MLFSLIVMLFFSALTFQHAQLESLVRCKFKGFSLSPSVGSVITPHESKCLITLFVLKFYKEEEWNPLLTLDVKKIKFTRDA